MKIAVVGSGISGNMAAWLLQPNHDVVVYEKRARLGGHSATVDVDYEGTTISVDTGFIVFNERNYPNLCALFKELGVASELIDMSFSVSLDRGGFEWSGDNLGSLFAQKRNAVSPKFWQMLVDILRFNRKAAQDLKSNAIGSLTLGAYLNEHHFSAAFIDRYLAPMGAAIWSTPHASILNFPAKSFIQFLANHKLLSVRPPDWMTVSGGSRVYVDKMMGPLSQIAGKIRRATTVCALIREPDGVTVIDENGAHDRFDQVILATHSDQALQILGEAASTQERALLSAVGYRDNEVILHRDPQLMPQRKAVWSAWNYLGSSQPEKSENQAVAVTYWMNTLQNIDKNYPLFVSLNPDLRPDPSKVFGTYTYAHPQFNAAALSAQAQLDDIQGQNRTWFCGAWCGYGFHEDGLKAGLSVAKRLGATLPWATETPAADPVSLPEAAE